MLEWSWATKAIKEQASPEALLEKHLAEILKYAHFRLGSLPDAEDATMEVIHAVRRNSKGLLSSHEPRLYLIGIARRKVVDILRKRPRTLNLDEQQEIAARSGIEELNRKALVGQILELLPDDHREVLALKYFHSLSSQEIGDLTGKSVAAVNSLLQRAREAFARHGEGMFEEDR